MDASPRAAATSFNHELDWIFVALTPNRLATRTYRSVEWLISSLASLVLALNLRHSTAGRFSPLLRCYHGLDTLVFQVQQPHFRPCTMREGCFTRPESLGDYMLHSFFPPRLFLSLRG